MFERFNFISTAINARLKSGGMPNLQAVYHAEVKEFKDRLEEFIYF